MFIFVAVHQVTEQDLRSLMFGDYMNPDLDPDEKVYEEVKSIEDFYAVAEQCMEEYNNTHKNRMDLVIFRWVQEWKCEFVLHILHWFSGKLTLQKSVIPFLVAR